jgi:hypothetical protein
VLFKKTFQRGFAFQFHRAGRSARRPADSCARQTLSDFIDVAGPHRQDNIAASGHTPDSVFNFLERRAEKGVRYFFRKVPGRYADGILFARGENLGEEDDVGAPELFCEIVEKRLGSGVGMRLEGEDDPVVSEGLTASRSARSSLGWCA